MEVGECHHPVMLDEVITNLAVKPDGVYVDATFGRGGHARALLDQLTSAGHLIVIDKDPEAIAQAEQLAAADKRVSVYHSSFSEIQSCVAKEQQTGKVSGILLDLGVSSPQLDNAERGFSFLRDGPLDMRMDTSNGEPASVWLASVSESDLAKVLFEFGEEKFARRIARAIVTERQKEEIVRTHQLAEIVKEAHPKWPKNKHPATQSFQAIRMFINRELEDITSCLSQCLEILVPGGRLAVISFHSLEDRIIKRFIQKHVRGDVYPAKLPIMDKERQPRLRSIGKGIKPLMEEVEKNARSRSAVLRIAEKLR